MRYLKYIITALGLGAIGYLAVGGATTGLTERHKVGEACWNGFTNSRGRQVIEEISTTTYKRLGEKGGSAFNPKKAGYTWQLSWCGNKYDSPNGQLNPGEFVDEGTTLLIYQKDLPIDKAIIRVPK